MANVIRSLRVALALMVCAGPLLAQDRAADVGLELAAGVLTGFPFGGDDRPEVLVGSLPAGLEAALQLPTLSRIVGSLSFPLHSFSLVALPPGSPARLEEWVQSLEVNGWDRMDTQPDPGFQLGPIRPSIRLCSGDSVTVALGPSDAPTGETYIHVFYLRDRPLVGCSIPSEPPSRVSPIPPLNPPQNSRPLSGSTGGGGADWRSTVLMTTDLPATALRDHYSDQLLSAGWLVSDRAGASSAAVAALAFTDAAGERWYGAISAVAAADSSHGIVSITVGQPGAQR